MRALLLVLAACAPAAPRPADQLGWLVGAWRVEEGRTVTEEAWSAAPDGSLLGSGRVTVDGLLGFAETLAVSWDGERLVYTAWPVGQRPVPFSAADAGPASVTFENPAHDFPRRITYARAGEALEVSATGVTDGAPREERWSLTLAP